MKYIEVNFDGLVGPTHHYAGLSTGNVASEINADSVSHPKQAALQGLAKMQLLHELGCAQGMIPPHPRPYLPLLNGQDIQEVPLELVQTVMSASNMWVANAATISPAPDTRDGKLHITPANLISKLHRAIEAEYTTQWFRTLFEDIEGVIIHDPLEAEDALADEGAANHMRLCKSHGELGAEVFVYGRGLGIEHVPQKYPVRQTREACEAIARQHQLSANKCLFIQQNPAVIDKGVFHNDVIAVANEYVLLYHEEAWVNTEKAVKQMQAMCDFTLCLLEIKTDELSVEEAVATYLFNSQIVTLPDNSMALIAPKECEEHPGTQCIIKRMVEAGDNPINAVHFVELRESMKNGGGPACLRLRMVMDQAMVTALGTNAAYSEVNAEKWKTWVDVHYPETLLSNALTGADVLAQIESVYDSMHDYIND